jgi:hypothetical protein
MATMNNTPKKAFILFAVVFGVAPHFGQIFASLLISALHS